MTKKVAVQKLTGIVSYQERVSKRDDIKRRSQALREELAMASSDAHNKTSIAEKAAGAAYVYKKTIQGTNRLNGRHSSEEDAMEAWEKTEFDKLQSAANAAEEAAKGARQRKEAIAQEINKLDRELENFGYLLGVDEVLRYQEDVASAEKQVAEFQVLIAEQEGVIEKARQDAPDRLDDLMRRREDILADISMNKTTDKDLKALDNEIAAQDKAVIEFNKIAGQAKQIIAGLQRKLGAAEDDLSYLQSKRDEIITEYLMGQAELLGEEYVRISMQLIDQFKQLVVLDQIIGYPSRLIGVSSDGFAIPTFKLKAFDGLELGGYYGQIYATRPLAGQYQDKSVIQTAVAEMKAMFSEAGINL